MTVYIVEQLSRFDFEMLPSILGVYTSFELAQWHTDEKFNIEWNQNVKGTGYTYDHEWMFLIKEYPLTTEKSC